MQNDVAFKCSRCGKYEYETELAEKVCKNCASKFAVENCHSAQQLKAEIAAYINELDFLVKNWRTKTIDVSLVIERLRQLSAV